MKKHQGGASKQAIFGALVLLALVWVLASLVGPHAYGAPVKTTSQTGEASGPSYTPPITEASPAPSSDRPLILYAYAESESARKNLEYFIALGLHGAADFIFVFNGESDATALIPNEPNIRVIVRENKCYDLGAFGQILRKDDLWKKYSRFITINASIRGPFLPHWSRGKGSCWSDLYLGRLDDKVKLVGMTANCEPRFHVQSMIWATDAVGMKLLLYPTPGVESQQDHWGAAGDPVAFWTCYEGYKAAVHAEVGTAEMIIGAGYEVDVMMGAFHKSPKFRTTCQEEGVGDVLYNNKYFGFNVHPYETIFQKANRDIDPTLLDTLTEWHLAEGVDSWSTCGRS